MPPIHLHWPLRWSLCTYSGEAYLGMLTRSAPFRGPLRRNAPNNHNAAPRTSLEPWRWGFATSRAVMRDLDDGGCEHYHHTHPVSSLPAIAISRLADCHLS